MLPIASFHHLLSLPIHYYLLLSIHYYCYLFITIVTYSSAIHYYRYLFLTFVTSGISKGKRPLETAALEEHLAFGDRLAREGREAYSSKDYGTAFMRFKQGVELVNWVEAKEAVRQRCVDDMYCMFLRNVAQAALKLGKYQEAIRETRRLLLLLPPLLGCRLRLLPLWLLLLLLVLLRCQLSLIEYCLGSHTQFGQGGVVLGMPYSINAGVGVMYLLYL